MPEVRKPLRRVTAQAQAQPAAQTPPAQTPTSTVTVVKKAAAPAPPAVAQDEQLDRLLHGAAAAIIIYGDTGSGKTTLLGTFARWAWQRFRAITRFYACDPGGYSDDILALVRLGIIEVWRMYTRDPMGALGMPSETLQRASQGWWPVEIDPATGECPAGSPLAAPDPSQRFAIVYDGLTSMQDWSMVDMGMRSARGTLGGEGANIKTIQSGELAMGVGNRASVGFTQGKARDWVLNSLAIPNLVAPPVFTALELKVTDSSSLLPLYGPKIAGQAKTTDVPSWFGATLGTCLAQDENGRPQWRLHLRDYRYPVGDTVPHKAKIRSSARLPEAELAKLPDYLADEAGDPPLTKFNLGYLLTLLEEVRMRALAQAAEEFPDAPGLKPSTIGTAKPPRQPVPVAGPQAPTALAPARLRLGAAPAPPAQKPQEAAPAAPAPTPTSAPQPEAGQSAPAATPSPAPAQAAQPAQAAPAQAAPAVGPRRMPPPGARPAARAPIAAAPAGQQGKQ